jgi:dihydrofolate reductase
VISLIVAKSKNNVIGLNGKMPWHLPNDLAYFKDRTMFGTIIMGGNTYRSLGKPLLMRNNIVISKNVSPINIPNLTVFDDFDKCLEFALKLSKRKDNVMIIGGSQIYELFMPYAQRMYITEINAEFDGDAFFPEFNEEELTSVS